MNFSTVIAPMTEVIKGTSFKQTPKTQSAFEEVKTKLTQAPVLALLCFEKVFEVECDAIGFRIGVVLTQKGKPLALFSEQFYHSRRKYSTHDKKFMRLCDAQNTGVIIQWQVSLFCILITRL